MLHFDINKTMIMCDPVKGVQCDDMVNSFLSEACYGSWAETQVVPADVEAKRALAGTWRMQRGPTTEAEPGLITYADLLEDILKLDKAELQVMKNRFAQAGEPGESVHQKYLDLQDKLRLPDGIALHDAPAAVGLGRYFIIPSFFLLMLSLEAAGRDFRIVFRTFGSDIQDVVKEFNLFCEGVHPCFKDVPTSMRRFALDFARASGTWMRDDAGLHLTLAGAARLDGAAACAAALSARLFGAEPSFSLALQDYFPYWRKSGEADDAGKPVFIEPLTEGSAHIIFFDDNVMRDRAHIIDVRDAANGEPLPFARTQGVHLVKAEPILAIEDPNYFVKAVAAAEEVLVAAWTAGETTA